MAVTFFPSNPNVSAAVQAQFGADAAVDVARIRAEEARALAQMQMQQQAQQQQREQFWRSQQAQQQDALAREQLRSTDFFNRGRLKNDEAQIAATLAANQSRDAATAAWHQAQLAPQLAKAEALKAGEAQDTAMLGAQLGNLAKVRNEYDRLTADLSKLTAMETAQAEQMKLPSPPSTAEVATLRKGYTVLGYDPFKAGYKPEASKADGTKLGGVNFGEPKKRMQDRLSTLAEIIKSNQELTTLLTKAPDGSWVPALPGGGAPAPSAQFWNTPTPAATAAPQAATFFRAPAVTNAPVVVPAAPPMTNAPALQRWVYVPGQGLVPR